MKYKFICASLFMIVAPLLLSFAPPVSQHAYPPLKDPASLAAIACGEPPLQLILTREGYTANTITDEVDAERFVKAGNGPVRFKPIAAYGLYKICSGGWYSAPIAAKEEKPLPPRPDRILLWRVDSQYNKQEYPPVMKSSLTHFNPGNKPFGVWVSSAGFQDENVYSEDALQVYIPRFKLDDRHKAHIFAAKNNKGKTIPNTYLIGWEYSTNNDDQDMVTMISNVKPVTDNGR